MAADLPEVEIIVRGGHPDFLDLPWGSPLEEWEHERIVPDGPRDQPPRRALRAPTTTGSTPSRRPRRRGRRPSTGSCASCGRTTCPASSRSACVLAPGTPGARRRRSSPATSTTRCLTATCSRARPAGLLDRVLLDAAVVLMARLHLEGFYWGDFSLSNALFRRDAGRLHRLPGRRRDGGACGRRSATQLRANDIEIAAREHRRRPGRPAGGGTRARGGLDPVAHRRRASRSRYAPCGWS